MNKKKRIIRDILFSVGVFIFTFAAQIVNAVYIGSPGANTGPYSTVPWEEVKENLTPFLIGSFIIAVFPLIYLLFLEKHEDDD